MGDGRQLLAMEAAPRSLQVKTPVPLERTNHKLVIALGLGGKVEKEAEANCHGHLRLPSLLFLGQGSKEEGSCHSSHEGGSPQPEWTNHRRTSLGTGIRSGDGT